MRRRSEVALYVRYDAPGSARDGSGEEWTLSQELVRRRAAGSVRERRSSGRRREGSAPAARSSRAPYNPRQEDPGPRRKRCLSTAGALTSLRPRDRSERTYRALRREERIRRQSRSWWIVDSRSASATSSCVPARRSL